MDPFFSVIVPVFNTGAYLDVCISSILNQKFERFEIILVDDGSTDGSSSMCNAYAEQDCRIKVFHKENGGVSSARNMALKESVGDYVVFVDSDDYLRNDALQVLQSTIDKTNSDLILFDITSITTGGVLKNDPDDTISELAESRHISKQDFVRDPSLLFQCAGGVPRTSIRREIINEIDATFPLGVPLSEDRIFLLRILAHVKESYYLKESLYYRVQRGSSAVHQFRDNFLELDRMVLGLIKQIINTDWDGDKRILKEYELHHINSCYYAGMMQFFSSNKCDIKQKLRNIKKITEDATLRRLIETYQLRDVKARLILAKSRVILPCLLYLSYLKLKYVHFSR